MRYFTVEFICDDLAAASELCKELQDKYDIACRKEHGTRISAWRDGAMEEQWGEQPKQPAQGE